MGTSRNNPGTNSFENRHSEMKRIATLHFEILTCNFWFHQMTCGKNKHATSLKTSSLGQARRSIRWARCHLVLGSRHVERTSSALHATCISSHFRITHYLPLDKGQNTQQLDPVHLQGVNALRWRGLLNTLHRRAGY